MGEGSRKNGRSRMTSTLTIQILQVCQTQIIINKPSVPQRSVAAPPFPHRLPCKSTQLLLGFHCIQRPVMLNVPVELVLQYYYYATTATLAAVSGIGDSYIGCWQ